MPTTTVTDVVTEAQALLNDTAGAIFTLAKLLPFVNKAYKELQNDYIDNGVQTVDEVSANVDLTVGDNEIAPQADIGTDFIEPVALYERPNGSTSEDDWVLMQQVAWIPNAEATDTFGIWAWQEQAIKLPRATVDIEVRVRYKKALTKFTVGGDTVAIENAQTFLAARAAALAAAMVGENYTRAEALQADADKAKEILLSINAKVRQNVPIRKRAYRRPRYRRMSV